MKKIYELWLEEGEICDLILDHLRKKGMIIPDDAKIKYNAGTKYDVKMESLTKSGYSDTEDFISVSFSDDDLQDYVESNQPDEPWTTETDSGHNCSECPADAT